MERVLKGDVYAGMELATAWGCTTVKDLLDLIGEPVTVALLDCCADAMYLKARRDQ